MHSYGGGYVLCSEHWWVRVCQCVRDEIKTAPSLITLLIMLSLGCIQIRLWKDQTTAVALWEGLSHGCGLARDTQLPLGRLCDLCQVTLGIWDTYTTLVCLTLRWEFTPVPQQSGIYSLFIACSSYLGNEALIQDQIQITGAWIRPLVYWCSWGTGPWEMHLQVNSFFKFLLLAPKVALFQGRGTMDSLVW